MDSIDNLLKISKKFLAEEKQSFKVNEKEVFFHAEDVNLDFPPIWDEERLEEYTQILVEKAFGSTDDFQEIHVVEKVNDGKTKISSSKDEATLVKIIPKKTKCRSVGLNVDLLRNSTNKRKPQVKPVQAAFVSTSTSPLCNVAQSGDARNNENNKDSQFNAIKSVKEEEQEEEEEEFVFPKRLNIETNVEENEIIQTNTKSTSEARKINENPFKLEKIKLPSVSLEGSLSLQENYKINILPGVTNDGRTNERHNVLYCEVNANEKPKSKIKASSPSVKPLPPVLNKKVNSELYDDLYSVNNTIIELLNILDNIDDE